uniref:Thioredoxin domain-containing protein n=1 Tax=uncultured bacterium fosmid pJB102C1 TaxID=1478050 RepID=A0A0H3UA63_9BACT|nr:hypothetical protein [uncultured bacterium fosmid pJB102C1]
MKKLFLLIVGAALLSACSQKFQVKGTLTGGDPEATVYLEHVGITNIDVVDSARLAKDGSFRFKAERPEYPDLYRLRVGNRSILLAVDSTETIGVTADLSNVLDAQFENSPESEAILALRRSLRDNSLADHKAFAIKQMLVDPGSIVAYYAAMQFKGSEPVFSLTDKEDLKYLRAVATSWQVWKPECDRTKVLCRQVLDQMKDNRIQENNAAMAAFIAENENTFLDVNLPDENGDSIALSSLRGKVILLDFCSTEIEGYKDYLFSMRDRYNKYHAKGLEVYQVYPDQNRLLWEDQVRELPWTTVRTQNGLVDPVYSLYNVQTIPTIYLINRKGEVMGRYIGFANLNEGIEALL